MPGEENESKTLFDLIAIGLTGAFEAAAFQAVRALRKHSISEWSLPRFITGLSGAAAVGAIAAWSLDAIGVNRELSAVAIAMLGYTGGRVLDLIEAEVPEIVLAAFGGVKRRFQEGKFKHDD